MSLPAPPHYVILSQSNLPSASSSSAPSGPVPSSSTLVFPTIHYHYADDPPLSLLPSKDAPPYLIMDWDPNVAPGDTVVKSISDAITVVGTKVAPAPGVSDAVDHDRNTNMFVIETISGNVSYAASSAPRNKFVCFESYRKRKIHGRANRLPQADTQDWVTNPSGALARFKQRCVYLIPGESTPPQTSIGRNAALREAFDHNRTTVSSPEQETVAEPRPSLSPTSSPETMKNVPLAP